MYSREKEGALSLFIQDIPDKDVHEVLSYEDGKNASICHHKHLSEKQHSYFSAGCNTLLSGNTAVHLEMVHSGTSAYVCVCM